MAVNQSDKIVSTRSDFGQPIQYLVRARLDGEPADVSQQKSGASKQHLQIAREASASCSAAARLRLAT
ncbi:hypothetical protein [Mesorhizobium sp.]|uniref:hypothetical protein n=1 Tax=Mesorhizobium sp. TaxID=1871066 RepID=UPI0025CD882F|nr:hypothetical protein [Mesorhizobium sp.]